MRLFAPGSLVAGCVFLSASPGLAQTEPETLLPDAITVVARAAHHAGTGDFVAAAEALEHDASTLAAVPRVVALAQATLLRDALDDHEGVTRNLRQTLELARTEPETRARAWALVERLGVRCERSAPAVDSTFPDAPETQARREHLRECLGLYRYAATFIGEDAPVDVRIGVRIATARVNRALQDIAAAQSLTREAIALYRQHWPDDPAVDVGLDGVDPYPAEIEAQRRAEVRRREEARRFNARSRGGGGVAGGYSGIMSPFDMIMEGLTLCNAPRDGVSPASQRAQACEAIAEGRLGLVLDALRRLDAPRPRAWSFSSRREFDAWARREMNPWITERLFRTRWLAAPAIAVVNTGAVAQAPAALYVFAQSYLDLDASIYQTDRLPDIRLVPESSYAENQAPRWFLHTAVTGFQRCRLNAIVARSPRWVRHCEEGLNKIDPQRFPVADEITPALRAGEHVD
jgi:hypothetical protein